MADIGHKKTDDIIDELEKKIRKEYEQANEEVQKKVDNYFARFKVKDAKKQAEVEAGTLSQKDYEEWRYGQMCVGERWKDLKDQLAKDYANTNRIARSIAEGYAPEVYALNHNFAAYQVQHDAKMDISWTLYNREAVEYLMKDDPQLLPFLGTHSPTAEKLRERMDMLWNRQHVNSAITQGILQGDAIPDISKRLQRVTDMNTAAATRNARTMMTSVENKARQDAYDRLKEKGVELQEMWMATLDSRTRHSHRALHGTYKDPKSGEYANGLRYPGDPMGEPEEIYNCRCCEIAEVEGAKVGAPNYSPKMGDMSFDEWLNGGSGHPMWMENSTGQDGSFIQFADGNAANEYFGKRPDISLRRENREEYNRQREEYNNSAFKTWRDNLTEAEETSVSNYTGDDYAAINGLLRHRMTERMVNSWNATGGKYTVQEMITNVESAIDKFELKDSIKVFRTCDPNIAEYIKFEKGTIFQDDAFVSTSTIAEKVASGNYVMEINVPAGIGNGAWVNPISCKQDEEYEFLLQRGSKFEITDVFERDGDTVIQMNLIGSERKEWSYATKGEVIEQWEKEKLPYDADVVAKI